MYYRGASAAIVVYDITNKDSFTGAKSWVKELQRRGDPNVVIALAGNKSDLEHKRAVELEEAASYSSENQILHLETSAKNAKNVKQLFVEIARKLPKNPPEAAREAFPIIPPKSESAAPRRAHHACSTAPNPASRRAPAPLPLLRPSPEQTKPSRAAAELRSLARLD